MSVRSKILIPMVIVSVLATSTILIFNIMQFSSFVDNYIEGELERGIIKTLDEIESLKRKSHMATLYFMNDNELIDAMERGDQKAVLKRSQEMFDQTGVESLSIVDENAIVLARAHTPELYGDDVRRMSMVREVFNGGAIVGASLGISTSLTIRSATPIYDKQGQMLGALFAGDRLDTEKFVDKLKIFTGCEITVLVDDVRVATTLYDKEGMRATGSVAPGYTERAILLGDGTTMEVDFQEHNIMERYARVLDNSGNVIGIVSVGKYLNEKQGIVTSFILVGFLITIVFIGASILIIFFVSRQIAAPINYSISQGRYDALTGVYNRRYLEEQLSILLKTLSRSDGSISLMMIDIDFFKMYNDTYGHIKGDNCLKAVADVLTQTVSREDDFVARYGGEEFVVVLPNTSGDNACMMAERLLKSVRDCNILHENSDTSEYITISIGVTTGHVDHSLSITDFIKRADTMLYESKRNGRNMYTFAPMKNPDSNVSK